MNGAEELKGHFAYWRARYAGGVAAALCAFAFSLVLLSACSSYWAGMIFLAPVEWRKAVYGAFAVWFACHAALEAFRLAGGLSASSLAGRVRAARPELGPYIVPAAEFISGGVGGGMSAALAEEHVRRTAELLRGEANGLFPLTLPGRERKILLGALLLSALTVPFALSDTERFVRLAFPLSAPALERYLDIKPGTAFAPPGLPAEIRVRWRNGEKGVPRLYVRPAAGGTFRPAQWDGAPGPDFVYRIDSLSDAVEYRLSWQDLRSSAYTISPRSYPFLKDMRIEVYPPAYTARKPYEMTEGALSIEALAGSIIKIRGVPSEGLSAAGVRVTGAQGSVRVPLSGGGELSASLRADADIDFAFELEASDGWKDPAPPARRVAVAADNPPFARLLSPGQDLEVAPGDVVPIVYEASDDIGLSSVELVSETRSAGLAPKTEIRPIASFSAPGPQGKTGDAALSMVDVPQGTAVEVWLAARDHNPFARGNPSVSSKIVIRVKDYGIMHAQAARDWRSAGDSLRRMAEKYDAQLRQVRASTAALSGVPADEIDADWDALERSVEGAVTSASADPYLNAGVLEEMKALSRRASSVRGDEAAAAARAAARGDAGEYLENMERASGELRAMSDSADAIAKMQFVKDFEGQAAEMADRQAAVENALADMLNSSSEKGGKGGQWGELEKAVESLRRQLEELGKLIDALPRPRSSGKGDERRVFQVPVGQAQELAGQLAQALARRDMASARELARRLSEQLARMKKVFSEAAQHQAESSSMGGKSDPEMDALAAEWEDLSARQERALMETQDVLSAQEGRKARYQEEKLTLLEKEQRTLAARADRTRELASRAVPGLMLSAAARLSSRQAQSALNAMTHASSALASVFSSTASVQAEIGAVASEQERIRKEFEDLLSSVPPPEGGEKARLSDGARVQADIMRRAGELRRRFGEKAARSMMMDARAGKKLSSAMKEMDGAGRSLGALDTRSASEAQQKALSELEEGRKMMEDSRQSMSRAGQGMSSSGRRMSQSGGARETPDGGGVKLPSAQDYLPPADVRREALRSLQEKFPRERDGLIRDYMRKLSQ